MKETEQTLLDQIKDEVATSNFNKHRWDLLYPYEERELWPIVCERYASACIEASLKKAAENDVVRGYCEGCGNNTVIVDKTSIVNNPDNHCIL